MGSTKNRRRHTRKRRRIERLRIKGRGGFREHKRLSGRTGKIHQKRLQSRRKA